MQSGQGGAKAAQMQMLQVFGESLCGCQGRCFLPSASSLATGDIPTVDTDGEIGGKGRSMANDGGVGSTADGGRGGSMANDRISVGRWKERIHGGWGADPRRYVEGADKLRAMKGTGQRRTIEGARPMERATRRGQLNRIRAGVRQVALMATAESMNPSVAGPIFQPESGLEIQIPNAAGRREKTPRRKRAMTMIINLILE